MFEQKEFNLLQNYVSFCEESSLKIYEIGLGYYQKVKK